jgi:hypothetical protein
VYCETFFIQSIILICCSCLFGFIKLSGPEEATKRALIEKVYSVLRSNKVSEDTRESGLRSDEISKDTGESVLVSDYGSKDTRESGLRSNEISSR